MTRKTTKETIESLVRHTDYPHTRNMNRKKPDALSGFKRRESLDRLCFYGKQLRKLGMSDVDIQSMFSDLYWDAVDEYRLNPNQPWSGDMPPKSNASR